MLGLIEQNVYIRMLNLVEQNVGCLNVRSDRAECSMSEC